MGRVHDPEPTLRHKSAHGEEFVVLHVLVHRKQVDVQDTVFLRSFPVRGHLGRPDAVPVEETAVSMMSGKRVKRMSCGSCEYIITSSLFHKIVLKDTHIF